MSLDTVSLALASFPEPIEGAESKASTARPVFVPVLCVNGKPLFRRSDQDVDTFALLLWSQDEGSFDLLTCSCGVAGCAGFHEQVEVTVAPGDDGGRVVEWAIPVCGYGPRIDPAHGSGPWTFRFQREQLVSQLAQLEAQLLAIEQRDGDVEVTPASSEDEEYATRKLLSVALAEGRERRALDLRASRQVTAIFGADADLSLRIEVLPRAGSTGTDVPAKVAYWMPVRRLGRAVLTDAGLPWDLEADADFTQAQVLLEQAATRLREDPVGLVLSLSSEERCLAAYARDEDNVRWLPGHDIEDLSVDDISRLTVTLRKAP